MLFCYRYFSLLLVFGLGTLLHTPVHAQVKQVGASFAFTCAVLQDNTVKCWGGDFFGILGTTTGGILGDGPGEMGDNLPRIDLGTGRTVTQLAVAGFHVCAILDDGSVKCWGQSNGNGALGYGDNDARGDGADELGDNLPTVDLGTGRTAKAIYAGSGSHTCVILDNDSVKCWGRNSSGELGYGDTEPRGDGPGEMGDNLPTVDLGTGRTAKALKVGNSSTCALLDDDTVKCWGLGNFLGYGDTDTRGDGPGEMGDNLPTVDLGTGRTAKAIHGTNSSTCAILDDDSVKCWGSSINGSLGYGDLENRGDAPGEMGDNLPTVDLGTGRTAKEIISDNITCAILDDDTLKCWGGISTGSLGLGDLQHRGDDPDEMGDNLPTVDLGTGRTAKKLAASIFGFQMCAILDDDTLKCWGSNATGELGLGDTDNRGDGPDEMGDNLPAIDVGTVIPLPVELTHFSALAEGSALTFRWQTAAETNNAGFSLQQQTSSGWFTHTFVEGHGTTNQPHAYQHTLHALPPGTHRFRLQQHDLDGQHHYSPILEVALGVPGTYHLSEAYPNPFNPATQVTLSVAASQHVTVTVHDALGREVDRLFSGTLAGAEARVLRFDAAGLPSGLYLLRATGETFTATRQMVLLK